MKRRLQVLAVLATALLAVRLMAQDAGSGDTSSGATGDTSGGATDNGGGNGGNGTGNGTSGGGMNGNGGNGQGNLPSGGSGAPAGGGDNSLFAPGASGGNGSGESTIFPNASPTPQPGLTGTAEGVRPSATPAASPTPNPFLNPGLQAAQNAPVTLEMPGGYGSAANSFTLGAGRLSKPPITYTFSLSQGYDDNINSAPSHFQTQAEPTPVTFEVQELTGQSRIGGKPPVPIFRTVTLPTPTPIPTVAPGGVVGSAVTQATLGLQVQKGTPRTVIIGDLNISDQLYWSQNQQQNYNGSLDLNFIHRLSPRATLTIYSYAVYQKSPNFNLINAPTNNGNNSSAYLNGSLKADLTYGWTKRISTVLTGNFGINYEPTDKGQDLYTDTFGIQFRYTVSARNTVTAEVREGDGSYQYNQLADTSETIFLLGLDSVFSAKLRNTFSAGIENHRFTKAGGGQTLPYFESAATYALPHGSEIQWTNRYGAEESPNAGVNTTSFRSSLSYIRPFTTKLVGSVAIAYNYLMESAATINGVTSGSQINQNQFQLSLGVGYTVSPRFSLNLSYTYIDLMSNQVNSSYTRDQTFLGGTYVFH